MTPKTLVRIISVIFPLALTSVSHVSKADCLNIKNNKDKFQVDVFTEIMTSGSLNVDEDRLFGSELKYFFNNIHWLNPFISGGYRTDLNNAGSNINIYHIDLGSQVFFGDTDIYTEYSVGATYGETDYSIQLIDREANNSFNEFTLKSSIAFGFNFLDDFTSKLSLTRIQNSTTLGLGFGYKF